jgi:hypothetical protein
MGVQTLGFEGINYNIHDRTRDVVELDASVTAAKNLENV